MIEPIFAEVAGGALIIAKLMFCAVLALIAGVIAVVYIYFNRHKHQPPTTPTAPGQPLQPVPPTPAAAPISAASVAPKASPLPSAKVPMWDKTVVMDKKCPQCGTALAADSPEGLCPACLLQRGMGTESGPAGMASAFQPPSISELTPLFPQLEILECLGRGGMGAVYKARQPRLDRMIALKILAPEKQNDPQFAERFEREARVLARLNHPNIVSVFDFGEVQGRFYLIMEFVDGLTLRQVMQAGKVTPDQALEMVPKICEALQFAHENGIVHRDIKPENILLDKQGRIKIADFGIAKMAGMEPTGMSLTGARDVMGTPIYMAPEQIEKPLSVDHRADIYSLGVVFYEMLTGELPLGKFAAPSKKVQMDVRLDDVVLQALEKEPSRRYQHASQVKTAVETIAGSAPPLIAAAPAVMMVAPNTSDKIILPAFLLAFFFGFLGAHRFYVGKFGTAILQLVTCGGFGIWATIDWILLVCKVFTDGQGRRMTNWLDAGPSTVPAQAQTQAFTSGSTIAPMMAPRKPRSVAAMVAIVCGVLFFLLFVVALIGALCLIITSNSKEKADPNPQFSIAGLRQENGEFWTNLTQTLPMDADGHVRIDNVNGQIQIHGWSSNAVVLTAVVHAKKAERVADVHIDVDSEPDHATIHTKALSDITDFHSFIAWLKRGMHENATVDYTLQVPAQAMLEDVSSVNGNIEIGGVTGDITTSTVNGETQIKDAAHSLKLDTVNGSITAEMAALGDGQTVKIDAVNGEIDLIVPTNADAKFTIGTVNGEIDSDFPALAVKKESALGNHLKGTLGDGNGIVKVDTINGAVRLKQPAATTPVPVPTPAPVTQ